MITKEILCLSGGLDSFIAWHYLDKPPTIYFDTKQIHSAKEKKKVLEITDGKVIIDTSLDFSNEPDIHIPHRNLLFASRASAHGDIVWIAGLKDDNVLDKNESAFNLMTLVLSAIEGVTVSVRSPFWKMTKADICIWAKERFGSDAERILNTESVSCYAGGTEPCHACESCFRKACAMHSAGMYFHFDNDRMVWEYFSRAAEREYVKERNQSIINFSNWYSFK